MIPISIRHYQPTDQLSVFKISADTAFFGAPVEAFLEDRHLYNDAFARYYTEQESALAWVAEGAGGLVGFLFGCADTALQLKKWRSYIIRRVLVNAISGKYKLGRRTGSFAWGMLAGLLRGEQAGVDLSEYPAHLQIDVSEGYRGVGVGGRLIDAYMQQLQQIGVRGVHLETTSHNEAACHLYEKVGFVLLDARLDRYWTRLLGFVVKNLSYGLKLSNLGSVSLPHLE